MKIAYKLRWVPLIVGSAVFFISALYWISVGMPYQDPTPEMYLRWVCQEYTARLWMTIGFAASAAGLVYYFVVKRLNKKRPW